MFAYVWPIGLAVLSNVIYHICAKETGDINPFASLTITYLVAAIFSGILFFVLNRGGNLITEYGKLNWAPFALGMVIVGLEVGFLYAYKIGWQVGTAALVQSVILSVILIFVGFLLYHEQLTWNKIAGILICLAGLWLINK